MMIWNIRDINLPLPKGVYFRVNDMVQVLKYLARFR